MTPMAMPYLWQEETSYSDDEHLRRMVATQQNKVVELSACDGSFMCVDIGFRYPDGYTILLTRWINGWCLLIMDV